MVSLCVNTSNNHLANYPTFPGDLENALKQRRSKNEFLEELVSYMCNWNYSYFSRNAPVFKLDILAISLL